MVIQTLFFKCSSFSCYHAILLSFSICFPFFSHFLPIIIDLIQFNLPYNYNIFLYQRAPMLARHLQSILYFARNSSKALAKDSPSNVPATLKKEQSGQAPQVKDKYSHLHKTGPELEVTKILIKYGPLTSKQIWRSYIMQMDEKKKKSVKPIPYFPSLSSLKKTLGFMRDNKKISSKGYNRKRHMFLGWKIDEKVALRYAHPSVLQQLEQYKRKQNQL